MSRLPTYYVSHGGGPWPWMREQTGGRYDRLEASLQAMAKAHEGQVRAILMVTAHWETPDFTLSSSPQPGMLYDYYGFPPHTYQVHYRAPGSPELAQRALELLQAGGVALGQIFSCFVLGLPLVRIIEKTPALRAWFQN